MKAIGIDIGTTSICGVLYDAEKGTVVRSVTKSSNAFLKGCADYEKIQSVEKIIGTATEILDGFISDEEGEVCSIGLTGQMHGIVYADADGHAVSPLYTWQDARGDLPYLDTTYAKYLNSFCGYGNVTDFYNVKNNIKPLRAVSHCTIYDYLAMHLCGLKTPVIHTSSAAGLGCYDIEDKRFTYDCPAEITDDFAIIGEYKGIPVSVGIGDNQASVFSTLGDESDLLLNIGTGSQISLISYKPCTADNIETRPYIDGKYLLVGAALCGGRAYSLLKSFYADLLSEVTSVTETQVYSLMNNLVSKIETPTLKTDTRFAGTRFDPSVKGSISNISVDNFTPSQLTKSFLQGMADELYNMYSQMNIKKSGIVGSGNGIRKNPALARIFEETFGSSLKIPAHLEEASAGAAMFALISCGVYDNSSEAQKHIKYI